MANRRFTQFFYSLHQKPVLIDCSFVVDATNANGVSSFVGPGVQNVFMHTSTTPSAGNPNPANGFAIVKLQDTYSKFFGGWGSVISPQSGSSLLVASAGLSVGGVYVITVLGTTTTAAWHALGVPAGTTPAVGVPFVAAATSAAGTGAVQVPAVGGSGIATVEFVGSPNLSIQSSGAAILGGASGAYVIARFLAPSFAGTALGTHTHDLKIIGGQAASTTNDVAVYSGPILGKEAAADSTILGANSATAGGVVAASAGTPAGTMSLVAAAPAAGSIISLSLYMSNSALLNNGE